MLALPGWTVEAEPNNNSNLAAIRLASAESLLLFIGHALKELTVHHARTARLDKWGRTRQQHACIDIMNTPCLPVISAVVGAPCPLKDDMCHAPPLHARTARMDNRAEPNNNSNLAAIRPAFGSTLAVTYWTPGRGVCLTILWRARVTHRSAASTAQQVLCMQGVHVIINRIWTVGSEESRVAHLTCSCCCNDGKLALKASRVHSPIGHRPRLCGISSKRPCTP